MVAIGLGITSATEVVIFAIACMALNILVASIGSWQFWRAGHFSWSLFWPFAILAVPFAISGWLAWRSVGWYAGNGEWLLVQRGAFTLTSTAVPSGA